MRFTRSALAVVVIYLSSVAGQAEDDGSYHFSEAAGRAAWVVDSESLPWIGSFDYLSSDSTPSTVLMTVVDSSTGAPLGECSVVNADGDDWERFVWTLSADSLQCNVSETNSSRVRFPLSAHPRTFSVRLQSAKGPRCLREVTVQNERPVGCPPHLRRNAFTAAGLVCGCPHADSTVESEADNPEFPLFELGSQPPPTQETPAWTVSPCANVQCLNNGTCVVGSDGAASCLCQSGFSGPRCQTDVCASVPCAHGGRCRSEGTTAVCECPPHTKGILCEQVVCEPSCAQGECSLVDGAPMCECNQGFIGPNCNVIDVCIGDAACAVFGEHAKCTLEASSYTTVSAKVVNATYDCHCPHPQTGQWMDCMALVLSSTLPSRGSEAGLPSSEEASAESSSVLPSTSTSTSTSTTTTVAMPVQLGAHVVTATAPSPGAFPPNIITAAPPPIVPSTAQNNNGQFNFMPFNPQTQQPPMPMHPAPVASTTVAPSDEEEEEESEEETTVASVPTAAPLPFRPFPVAESTAFPTPAPMDVSEMETTEENLGAGFETSVAENIPEETTTAESEEEQSEETSTAATAVPTDGSAESSTPSSSESSSVPAETEAPLWPMPTQEIPESTPSPHTSTEASTEMVSSAETTQSVLPFWMMSTTQAPEIPQTAPTQAPTEEPSEEEEEEEEEETGAEETHTERPEHPDLAVPEHIWPTTTQKPEEETKAPAIATGNSAQGGSSAVSWIVAILAVCVLGALLLASVVFAMRYIRQSRKLHGKYNPAREEHALSAAYSLPMTHVTKEERLI